MDDQKIIDIIKKYKELLDMGAITQAEFDAKKAELLGAPLPTPPPVADAPVAEEPEQDDEEPEQDDEEPEQPVTSPYKIEAEMIRRKYDSSEYAKPFAVAALIIGFIILFLLGGFTGWVILCLISAVIAAAIGYTRKLSIEKETRRNIPFDKLKSDTISEFRKMFSSTATCVIALIAAITVLGFSISSCSGTMDSTPAQSAPVTARKTTVKATTTTTVTTASEVTTTTNTTLTDDTVAKIKIAYSVFLLQINELDTTDTINNITLEEVNGKYRVCSTTSISTEMMECATPKQWKEYKDIIDSTSSDFHAFFRNLDALDVDALITVCNDKDSSIVYYRSLNGNEVK